MVVSLAAAAGLAAVPVISQRSIHFVLNKHTVTAGHTFTVASNFHNIWLNYIRPGGQARIVDEKGVNWLVSSAAGAKGGMVDVTRGDDVVAQACLNATGIPTRAPLWSTEKQSYLVLPGTPPGKYAVQIPANRFCGEDATNAADTLYITVKR